MSRTLAGAILALALLVAAGWFFSRPSGSDQEQILRLLRDAQSAANGGSPGGIMSLVSVDYRGTGGTRKELRLLVLQATREGRITLSLDTPRIAVEGNTAAVDVFARAALTSTSGTRTSVNSEVTLALRREDGRRFVVFPVTVWRVISADVRTGIEGGL